MNNKFKHLICFDLSSYGAALSLLNQFADGENIKDFEVSPSGQGAQLILLSQDLVSLQVLKGESSALFKSQILNAEIVENIHPDLLSAYLSQNKTQLQKNIFILEGSSTARAFVLAQELLTKNLKLVDFRVVRTFPKNVILTVTSDSAETITSVNTTNFKTTVIESVQNTLKSYYEV